MQQNGGKVPSGAGELRREFRFVRELGHGGSAVVYLAHDRELDRDVAIKLIRTPLAGDEETLARFAGEARAAARLHHPNIVSVYAVRRLRDGTLALVMQHVPGRTLKQAVLSDGPFAFERAERVLREIGAALAHAHERGVVHRDVKPENIFLHEETGSALLSDFGIARVGGAASGLTIDDVAIGTPSYMAPEQIDGSSIDGRVDLYSLASVGWEMLTGQAPWEGESLYSVIYKQKHEMLAPIRRHRPDVPRRLWWTVERGLEKDRDRRFPDAAMMLAALDGADGGGLLERFRARLRVFVVRGSSAPAPPPQRAALEEDADSGAETIRYQREAGGPLVAAAGASTGAAPAPDLPGFRRAFARPGTRYAATTAALLLLTGLGATLAALNRTADDGFPSGAVAPSSNDGLAGPAVTISEQGGNFGIPLDGVGQEPGGDGGDLPLGAVADSVAAAQDGGSAETAGAAETGPESAETADAAAAEPAVREAPRFSTSPAIAAGGLHTCAVTTAGEVLCWGGNSSGQIGDGSNARSPVPVRVPGEQRFRQVSAGLAHNCAVTEDARVLCWGSNDSGQLGDGSRAARSAPRAVSGGQRFQSVATGSAHTCGITAQGEIFCWGGNNRGQVGDGSGATRTAPRRVSGGRFSGFAVGWNHTCALNRQGQAFCWGANGEGQLGTGAMEGRNAPTAVEGGTSFRQIAAGGGHTCGLTAQGEVFCWGANSHGQLGDGTTTQRSVPGAVEGGASFASITAGGVHTCGLTRGGEALCWGRNMYGQLGDGSRTDRSRPVAVAGNLRFASIHASGSHTCGVTRQGEQFCWGYNVEGQIGDGTRSHRTMPARVPGTGR